MMLLMRKWLPSTLFTLIATLVLWQSAQLTWDRELERLENQATNELLLHVTSLRGKLEKHEYLAQLLNAKEDLSQFLRPDADPDELQQLNILLDRYRVIAEVSDIYLMNHDGRTVAASNWWRPDSFRLRRWSSASSASSGSSSA